VFVGAEVVVDPPPGFDEFSDLEHSLVVVDGDGNVVADRPVPASELVAADGDAAYMTRTPRGPNGRPVGPTELVAQDLASGDERVLHTGPPVDADVIPIEWAASALVGDELLTATASMQFESTGPEGGGAEVPGSQRCGLRRLDLATGEAAESPLGFGCSEVRALRASPDATHLAVVYVPPWDGAVDGLPEQRVAIVRVADGAVVHDALLGHDLECDDSCPPDVRPFHVAGVAWQDGSTLRVASTTAGGDLSTVLVEVG
jgi:hypothetical protein